MSEHTSEHACELTSVELELVNGGSEVGEGAALGFAQGINGLNQTAAGKAK